VSLVHGTREEQRLRLLERARKCLQDAQNLRVDAIAEGNETVEWEMERIVETHKAKIADLESKAPK